MRFDAAPWSPVESSARGENPNAPTALASLLSSDGSWTCDAAQVTLGPVRLFSGREAEYTFEALFSRGGWELRKVPDVYLVVREADAGV